MTEYLWRIYYDDFSTFDNTQGSPEDAPGVGVIVIVIKHEDSRIRAFLQHEGKFYTWWANQWWACDDAGLWDYLFIRKFSHPKVVLLGRYAENPDYDQIMRAAKSDKDFYG